MIYGDDDHEDGGGDADDADDADDDDDDDVDGKEERDGMILDDKYVFHG